MKIGEKFGELKKKKEGALIAYICAGDPTPEKTKEYVEALVRGGADIVELGLPFSDPVADGPTIQAGLERALNGGMTPDIYFETAGSLSVNTPLVVMTYYNLIFRRGLEKFVKDCVSSGISSIIVPDLPAEESGELAAFCKKHGVDLIFLVAPTTTESRMKRILAQGTGFIYLVARLGVTGARADVAGSTRELIKRVKTTTPKAVGFGISNGKQAAEIMRAGADGVIVGSAFVDIIASGNNAAERLEALARELKEGIRAARGSKFLR
ncbi:MAG: tryptophan synthase subunit alpha [Candidatus Methanoperedens sp.]|nr:tryptophan synthase subunit alpha [Candidatus Methanoperedens sp.]MCZ7395725.1 tryptophan synthase subunit alpha [Candidatus Methanoperedens sp.]